MNFRVLDELNSERETLRLFSQNRNFGFSARQFPVTSDSPKTVGFGANFQFDAVAVLPNLSIDMGTGKMTFKFGEPKVETGPLPSDKLERRMLDRLKNSMVYYKISF